MKPAKIKIKTNKALRDNINHFTKNLILSKEDFIKIKEFILFVEKKEFEIIEKNFNKKIVLFNTEFKYNVNSSLWTARLDCVPKLDINIYDDINSENYEITIIIGDYELFMCLDKITDCKLLEKEILKDIKLNLNAFAKETKNLKNETFSHLEIMNCLQEKLNDKKKN